MKTTDPSGGELTRQEIVNSIESALDRILDSRIQFSNVLEAPYARVDKHLINQKSLTGFAGYVDEAFGWIPLNPNDPDRVRAIVSAYHISWPNDQIKSTIQSNSENEEEKTPSEQVEDYHPICREYGECIIDPIDTSLPSRESLLSLFQAFSSRSCKFISITGDRGSGKTMAMNFFLATAHHALSERGVLWLRTDVAKLWNDYKDESSAYLDILNYTILHSIYVIIHYSEMRPDVVGSDPNLIAFANGARGFQSYLDGLVEAASYEGEVRLLWGKIQAVYKNSIRQANAQPKRDRKPIRQFISDIWGRIRGDERQLTFLRELFSEILTFLRLDSRERHNRELRVVVVIDGIDNVRVGAHQERYSDHLRATKNLIDGIPVRVADAFVVMMRPETLLDYDAIGTGIQLGGGVPGQALDFSLRVQEVGAILKRKEAALREPGNYLNEIAAKEFISSNNNSKQLDELRQDLNFLTERLSGIHPLDQRDAGIEPLTLLFGGNIRSLLRNCVRAYNYRIALEKEAISVQVNAPASRHRLLLSGSILAGCTLMADNESERVRGRWCPNLFGGAGINGSRWDGLALVRLIQLMSASKSSLSAEEIHDFLSNVFGYTRLRISECFHVARDFALIRQVESIATDFDEDIQRVSRAPAFSTSAKGRYVMRLALEDFAVFYFMGASTRMDLVQLLGPISDDAAPREFLHSSDPRHRHFVRSAIQTGILLYKHILQANKDEMEGWIGTAATVRGIELKKELFDIGNLPVWRAAVHDRLKLVSKKTLRKIATIAIQIADGEGPKS